MGNLALSKDPKAILADIVTKDKGCSGPSGTKTDADVYNLMMTYGLASLFPESKAVQKETVQALHQK